MRSREMNKMLKWVPMLTAMQRAVLACALECKDHSARVRQMIESRVVQAQTGCPHCGHTQLLRHGQVSGLQRWRCKACGRTFNALTKTPMARLRMKAKWLLQQQVSELGLSVAKAAAQLQVSPSTAFRWRHRFLKLAQPVKAQALLGVAEADETYFLHSNKGQSLSGRKARHRGGKASKRGLSRELIPVLVARDRSGATADFVLSAASKAEIVAALQPRLSADAVLCTDGSLAMATAAKQLGVHHEAVNLSAGERVRGAWHIQNANAYHSRLKAWLRRFNGIATSHLESYLAWFRALDRSAKNPSKPAPMLALALGLGDHP